MVAAIALVVAGLVTLAGTIGQGHKTSSTDPIVSRARASRVLRNFTADYNEAASSRRVDVLDRAVTETLLPIQIGSLKIAAYQASQRRTDDTPHVRFSHPRFLIPPRHGYPEWFATVAGRSDRPGTYLLVFTKDRRGEPFKAAYATRILAGRHVPRIGTDRHGLARSVRGHGSGLALGTNRVAAVHADAAEHGGGSTDNTLVPGPWTTGLHAATKRNVASARRTGFRFHRTFHPSGYPSYALRVAGGGALVWYAITDEVTVDHIGSKVPRNAGRLHLAGSMAGIIGVRRVANSFQAVSIHEYLTYVPPRGQGRARVIGQAGGPVGGIGY